MPSFIRRFKRRSFSEWISTSYGKPVAVLVFSLGEHNTERPNGQPSLLDQSLSFFSPKILVLLATEKSSKSALQVEWIEKKIWEVSHSEIISENIRSKTRQLSDGVDLDGEIVFDITGGTKSMSISAYQVAEQEGYIAAYRVQGEDLRYEIYGSAGS